jgi:hypothetical protein
MGKNLSRKKMWYNYRAEMFNGKATTIRKIGDPDNWRSGKLAIRITSVLISGVLLYYEVYDMYKFKD